MAEPVEKNKDRKRQRLSGVVTSTGGDKTIHVAVNRLLKHRQYGKYIRRRSKLAVHDERSDALPGDLVEIVSCRKLSKTKGFRLVRVIRRAALTEGS